MQLHIRHEAGQRAIKGDRIVKDNEWFHITLQMIKRLFCAR